VLSSAESGSTSIVAYLALFAGGGILFVYINLLIGWLLRPRNPHQEKLEIYECGEPTIGSSFVQFDLRFYVVALIFIVFDVEVAFLFPWATVLGKANHLMQPPVVVAAQEGSAWQATAWAINKELGLLDPVLQEVERASVERTGRMLLDLTIVEGLVFFLILLVGFAYVWKLGALDWVRAAARERAQGAGAAGLRPQIARETALSA
jgi:NADH-quinone oxidoreductase subunit A